MAKTFRECLEIERAEGRISQRVYDDFRSRAQQRGFWDSDGTDANLQAELAALTRDARESRRRAEINLAKHAKMVDELRDYTNRRGERDAAQYFVELVSGWDVLSVDAKARGKFAEFEAMLGRTPQALRSDPLLGLQWTHEFQWKIVDEVLGYDSGDPAAKEMAALWSAVIEKSRQELNAQGASIAKIDGYLPQHHDPMLIANAARGDASLVEWHNLSAVERLAQSLVSWKDFIRGRLDWDKMKNPLRIDGKWNDADKEAVLDETFYRIVNKGAGANPVEDWGNRGKSLAAQYSEHRVLAFTRDGYREYQQRFGGSTPWDTMRSWMGTVALDWSMMHTFGSNPEQSFRWAEQVILSEFDKWSRGDPDALFPRTDLTGKPWKTIQDAENYMRGHLHRLHNMQHYLSGLMTTPVNTTLADIVGTVKSLFVASKLGGTFLRSIAGDPFLTFHARLMSGLPLHTWMTDYFSVITAGGRQEMLELGVMNDSDLNVRWADYQFGRPLGPQWARWFADRTMTLSLLKVHTQGMKSAHARGLLIELTKRAGVPLPGAAGDALGTSGAWGTILRNYGITDADWAVWSATPPRTLRYGVKTISPMDIADANVRMKFLAMINMEIDAAVPSGTLRSQSLLRFGTKDGTAIGTLVASMSSVKSFMTVLHQKHMYDLFRVLQRRGVPAATAHFLLFVGMTTVGGALGNYLVAASAGRVDDRWRSDDAEQRTQFWAEAAMAGGGGSVFAEILASGRDVEGDRFADKLLGPLFNAAMDWATALVVNPASEAGDALAGADDTTNMGSDAVRALHGIAPFSTLWYTRVAQDRLLYDSMLEALDPEGAAEIQERRRQFHEDKGVEWWWAPGEDQPNPDAFAGE